MSSNLVIVALPADDDPIWKISSEKKPHLTLLFLGDAESNQNVDSIALFVQHAVSIREDGPFYLDVDRRGVLGDDDADVLHFRKNWSFKWVNRFRNQLLQNTDIRTAYDSVDQYPEWLPHLTLGYPDTPANEDKIPEYGLHGVRFDRIAVWTGDYEGPDFRLEWPEGESELAVAYSDTGKTAVEELLHFGTKGMRWGQRKTETVSVGGKTKMVTPKKAEKLDKHWEKNIYTIPGAVAVHNAMADHFNQRIGALNDKYPDNDFSGTKWDNPDSWTPREKQYMKDVEELTLEGTRRGVQEVHGTSPTGKLRAELSGDGDSIVVRETKIEHADSSGDAILILRVKRNGNGLITEVETLDDIMAQSAISPDEFIDELMHYGIKGMRWGVRNRKGTPIAVEPTASSKIPPGKKRKTKVVTEGGENLPASEDAIKVAKAKAKLQKSGTAALSNQELREVADRLRLEAQVKELAAPRGQKFVKKLLTDQGTSTAKAVVRESVETRTGVGGNNKKK